MLRLSELRLPLGHPPEAMVPAICERLGITPDALLSHEVVRRANDARRKSAIKMVYSLDLVLRDEPAILARFADDPNLKPTPDTHYRAVAHVRPDEGRRPVVIGAGPCGLFAG